MGSSAVPGGHLRLIGPVGAVGWRRRAACRGTGPELFFAAGVTGPAAEMIEAAKAVCRDCPVAAECLDYAVATDQWVGVWGGTSEVERQPLRQAWVARRQAMHDHPASGRRRTRRVVVSGAEEERHV